MHPKRLLLCLVLFLLAAFVHANGQDYGFDVGHSGFVLVDPTTGQPYPPSNAKAPTGGTWPTNTGVVAYDPDVFGVGYGCMDSPYTGSCSGAIRYCFKWASTNTGPPPSQVVLRVSCLAEVRGGSAQDVGSASADDGIGDAAVTFGPGGKPHHELDDPYDAYLDTHSYGIESAGVHCVVVDVQDGAFEYDLTPAASNPASYDTAIMRVEAEVTVCDVNFSVAGTQPDGNGGIQCLVGQNQVASVGSDAVYLAAKSWSVPGTGVFGNVLTSGAQPNPDFPAHPDGTAAVYYDDYEYNPSLMIATTPRYPNDLDGRQTASFYNALAGTEQITCTVNVHDLSTDAIVGTVTLKKTVQVVPPDYTFTQKLGVSDADRASFVGPDAYDPNSGLQRLYSAHVNVTSNYTATTQDVFLEGDDHGKVAICQLLEDDRVHTPDTDGKGHTGTTDGTGYWLDNTFPYPGSQNNATTHDNPPTDVFQAIDLPDDLLSNPDWTAVSIHNLYLSTCIYRAPGVNSVFVPLSTLGWTWVVSANTRMPHPKPPATNGIGNRAWLVDGGIGQNPNVHFLYDLPSVTWKHAFLNSQDYVKP